ncbi:DUF5689 domain-containing protein [Pedobacter sp. KBW06]|uniref:DUF5689 domain-containing protein n=1 Tax=Pedobacter sp. KBW06 TaxID=2153359 RepID=UPI0018F3EBF9|nr:DUF5689 domain-containing protein [Pedobacter sp. KBW06]
MKQILYNSLILLSAVLTWSGCKQDLNYPGGEVYAFFPLLDLRGVYKGTDLTLNKQNMLGSTKIEGTVISDHSGKNLPAGLLVIESNRRIGLIRGISIPIGAAAVAYMPGDSLHIDVEGAVLKRVDGILQITGIPVTAITKIASNVKVPKNRVASSDIIANPDDYESTLVAVVKAGFVPSVLPTDVYSGDKIINDGFGAMTLHTETGATFAGTSGLSFNAVYYGIPFNKEIEGKLVPQHRIRTINDVKVLSSVPEIADIIITGFYPDPIENPDTDHEYMQFMATRDIDFSVSPFSVVTTNNAGATNPTGFPTQGWATGTLATSGSSRTFKFNLTTGKVSKGEFFYVGGAGRKISGINSTDISSSKWIRFFDYSKIKGDGFGRSTTNLLANSGNSSGFAVFKGTTVDVNTVPVDVIFVDDGGSIYNGIAAAPVGYKIANTDFYDKVDLLSDNTPLTPTPYFLSGDNKRALIYPPGDAGYFIKLGGIYNPALGKWMKARRQVAFPLPKSAQLSVIEGLFPEKGYEGFPDGYPATQLQ